MYRCCVARIRCSCRAALLYTVLSVCLALIDTDLSVHHGGQDASQNDWNVRCIGNAEAPSLQSLWDPTVG